MPRKSSKAGKGKPHMKVRDLKTRKDVKAGAKVEYDYKK